VRARGNLFGIWKGGVGITRNLPQGKHEGARCFKEKKKKKKKKKLKKAD